MMVKMNRTSHLLVPVALAVMGVVVLCLFGCKKQQEEAKSVDPSSPAVYMKDPAFRQQLKNHRMIAADIGEAREKVTARQDEMVKATGAKLKTDDRKAIVAALASDEEWRSLEAKAKELDEAFKKNHRETMRIVRERITPKGKRISK